MTEIPVEGSSSSGAYFSLSEEQLNCYIGDTVCDFPELFTPAQPHSTLGSDSEGVVENLLENGEEIMKDLMFKKISDNFLKPRDFPGKNKLDFKLQNMVDSKIGFSTNLDKLFIQKNAALCFSLTYDRTSPNAQYSLLSSVIFTDPKYKNIPVKVCLNHRDSSKGFLADHFLKVECAPKETRYFTAPNDTKMLKIENLPNISESNRQETSLKLVFTDFSSCVGGVNRRNICVVFCLEEKVDNKVQIVSTKVLNVKVCENAKRDMKSQENQKRLKMPKIVVESQSSEREDSTGEEQFWVLATNKRNYEALLKVGAVMEEHIGGDVEVWRKEVDQFNNKKTRIELYD